MEEEREQIDETEDEIRGKLDELDDQGDEMDRGSDDLERKVGDMRDDVERKQGSSEAPGLQEPLEEVDDDMSVNAQEPGGADDELTEDDGEPEPEPDE